MKEKLTPEQRAEKKAATALANLARGQQKTLSSAAVQTISPIEEEVRRAVKRIKTSVEIFNESKVEILKELLFLREHQKELELQENQTFEQFINEVVGYSKQYFYQLTGVYSFLKENDKLELFDQVDYKILNEIKRLKDPKEQIKFLKKAKTLTRADIDSIKGKVSRAYSDNIIDAEIIPETPQAENTIENTELKEFKKMITAKITKQIYFYEKYIKQLKKAKTEKEISEGKIKAYQIVITDFKEILKGL